MFTKYDEEMFFLAKKNYRAGKKCPYCAEVMAREDPDLNDISSEASACLKWCPFLNWVKTINPVLENSYYMCTALGKRVSVALDTGDWSKLLKRGGK